jgi:hypothetical protein
MRACMSVSRYSCPNYVLSEVIKECVKEDARGWSSLTDLHPMCKVVPCHWLIGVTQLRNKGHTLLKIVGVMARLLAASLRRAG